MLTEFQTVNLQNFKIEADIQKSVKKNTHTHMYSIYSFIMNQRKPINESINRLYTFFLMDSFLLVYGQFLLKSIIDCI